MNKNAKVLLKDVNFNFSDDQTKCGPHIAYTLPSQGGAASGKNQAFLFKADDVEITTEIIKELEQVQLNISMEEFLEKFMGLWNHQHREILTKLMGLETESEYALRTDMSLDTWDVDWLERKVADTDNALTRFQVLKSAQDGEDLPLEAQIELFNIRKQFEKNYEDLSEQIEECLNKSADEEVFSDGDDEIEKSSLEGKEISDNLNPLSEDNTSQASTEVNKTKEEDLTLDIQELLKSQDFADYMAAQKTEIEKSVAAEYEGKIAELEKANTEATQELQKAKAERMARIEKGFTKGVETLSFVAEDAREDIVKGLVENHDNALVLKMFGLLEDAQAEIEKTKEEFALTETGVDKSTKTTDTDEGLEALEKALAAKYGDKEFL